MELIKHINLKHKNQKEHISGTIICENCEEQFSSRWNLMNHKKEKHPSQSPCKYNLQNKCKFTAEDCWHGFSILLVLRVVLKVLHVIIVEIPSKQKVKS